MPGFPHSRADNAPPGQPVQKNHIQEFKGSEHLKFLQGNLKCSDPLKTP
jgi:hypothetical protein